MRIAVCKAIRKNLIKNRIAIPFRPWHLSIVTGQLKRLNLADIRGLFPRTAMQMPQVERGIVFATHPEIVVIQAGSRDLDLAGIPAWLIFILSQRIKNRILIQLGNTDRDLRNALAVNLNAELNVVARLQCSKRPFKLQLPGIVMDLPQSSPPLLVWRQFPDIVNVAINRQVR